MPKTEAGASVYYSLTSQDSGHGAALCCAGIASGVTPGFEHCY